MTLRREPPIHGMDLFPTFAEPPKVMEVADVAGNDISQAQSRNRIQYPCPRADAFVKALHIVFLVGGVNLIVILAKADKDGRCVEDILEMPRDGDRATTTDICRRYTPFVAERLE